MEENFDEILQDAYNKTLKLAVDIAQNKTMLTKSQIHGNDMKFVKKIAKGCKEFQDMLVKSVKKPVKFERTLDSPLLSPLKLSKHDFLPKDSGKQKLNVSLEERKRFVSGSKAGKPIKYAEIGPSVLEKLKTGTSEFTEEPSRILSTEKSTTLPQVSIRTGRVKPALELPSFKEYIKSERAKDLKDVAFERINQCKEKIDEFGKKLSGLEIFISHNPGVPWNQDKKVLLRLNAFPNQKALILKAYNDSFESGAQRKVTRKATKGKKEAYLKGEKFLSKTPNPKAMEDYYMKQNKIDENPEAVVQRCYSRFNKARNKQNKKLISILETLNLTRSVNLKQKAMYILNDTEKFKDKSHSLNKMNEIKRKIDWDQTKRINKSRKQVVVYDSLMDYLKKKQAGPSDAEINFVEILKEILEEGWAIDSTVIDRIVRTMTNEDLKELQPLIDFLTSELDNLDKSSKLS